MSVNPRRGQGAPVRPTSDRPHIDCGQSTLSEGDLQEIRTAIAGNSKNANHLLVEKEYRDTVLEDESSRLHLDVVATSVEVETGEFDAEVIAKRYIQMLDKKFAHLLWKAEIGILPDDPSPRLPTSRQSGVTNGGDRA